MDPNATLESILRGNMLAEHAEALRDWLLNGGFTPCELLMPCDKHPFFATHCERTHGDARGVGVRVKANSRGIWTYSVGADDWFLAATYEQLIGLGDQDESF